jgi:hypothetical protein
VTDRAGHLAESGPARSAEPEVVSHESDQKPWYRRRGLLVAAIVVAVLAITVVTDLPSHATRATNIASANTVITEVNSDMSSCVFAAKEAFTIYADQLDNSLTATDRSKIPSLLTDDETACSFTNDAIFSLSDVEVPGSEVGKQLGHIVNSVTLWATSDALGAIEAIQRLSADPRNADALATLAKSRQMLAADRAAADTALRNAETTLDTTLIQLYLPQIPRPSSP